MDASEVSGAYSKVYFEWAKIVSDEAGAMPSPVWGRYLVTKVAVFSCSVSKTCIAPNSSGLPANLS